jgi:hypothetical protein
MDERLHFSRRSYDSSDGTSPWYTSVVTPTPTAFEDYLFHRVGFRHCVYMLAYIASFQTALESVDWDWDFTNGCLVPLPLRLSPPESTDYGIPGLSFTGIDFEPSEVYVIYPDDSYLPETEGRQTKEEMVCALTELSDLPLLFELTQFDDGLCSQVSSCSNISSALPSTADWDPIPLPCPPTSPSASSASE